MTLGEAIKQVRLAEGLTQESLAIMSGFHICTIKRWELGQKEPKLESMKRVAEAVQRDLVIKYTVKKKVLSIEFALPEVIRLQTLDEKIASKKIQDKLFAYCMKLCEYNREKARDLSQETTMTALINQHRYDKSCQLITWIIGIAKNLKHRELRGISKLTYVENYIDTGEITDDDNVPVNCRRYIAGLTNTRRKLYGLRIRGYDYRKIAEELNLKPGYVKTRFCQMRKELTELVKTN